MAERYNYKLNDGFEVSKFMVLLDVDFVYSTETGKETFYLLNEKMFGQFKQEDIDKQIKFKKVIVIFNDTLKMETYNIPEADLINAFMNMGK